MIADVTLNLGSARSLTKHMKTTTSSRGSVVEQMKTTFIVVNISILEYFEEKCKTQ